IPSMVPAILADLHGDRRDAAITEATGVSYLFAIVAPLITSLAISATLGWRLAVLAGAAMAVGLLLVFGRLAGIDSPPRATSERAPLPPSYWAFWLLVAIAVALEYCVLLWAPTFLEAVVGLSQAAAAGVAVAFPVAVLIGRLAGSGLLRIMTSGQLFL